MIQNLKGHVQTDEVYNNPVFNTKGRGDKQRLRQEYSHSSQQMVDKNPGRLQALRQSNMAGIERANKALPVFGIEN